MTKSEFIQGVIDEITASGAIPFSLPSAEIERITDIEAEWMYREYRNSVHDAWYVLNKKYFHTEEWKRNRTFQLPSCVMGVKVIFEMSSGQRVFGIHDPDMSFDRLMAADLFLTPLSSDQIAYRTVQWSFWDLAKQFNLRDINHNFNVNTKRLIITGRDPSESLWLVTLNKIPEVDLYDDPIFRKWVVAKSKIQLSRILGSFSFKLIGDVTINIEGLKSEGTDDLKVLEEKIKSDSPMDWFIMMA